MERSTEKNERHLNLTEEVKDMKRSLKVLCLVLSAALLLAGCGGNGAATQQGAVVTVGEGAEEGATATAEAATNIDRDDVIFCMLNEPKSLDPLEGENAQEKLPVYADPDSSEYAAMVEEIRRELKFTTLKYHRLDDMLASTQLSPCKLCTYCWDGRE